MCRVDISYKYLYYTFETNSFSTSHFGRKKKQRIAVREHACCPLPFLSAFVLDDILKSNFEVIFKSIDNIVFFYFFIRCAFMIQCLAMLHFLKTFT